MPARPSAADRRHFDRGIPATLLGASGCAELSLSCGSAAEAGLPCTGRAKRARWLVPKRAWPARVSPLCIYGTDGTDTARPSYGCKLIVQI